MRGKTALILLAVAVLVLGGGWYFGHARAPRQQEQVTGQLAFPGLAARLGDAARIEIVHQNKPLVILRHGDAWGLEDRSGYPVQPSKLREMLTGLTELRIVEPRTTDSTQFARLGVEDPHDPKGNANLLRVLDASGTPIAELIVGHRRTRIQGNVPESVYVRRPGEDQAWLAEGRLPVDADPQLWLDRDIMNIDHSRIASVTVKRGGQTLDFAPQGDRLVLISPANHPELDPYKLDELERGLELLTLQDVRPANEMTGEPVGESVFVTKDGLRVTLSAFDKENELWARFAVTGSGDTQTEADKLRAKLDGWAYQLGSWKEKALVPTLDDVKASAPAPAPAESPKQ